MSAPTLTERLDALLAAQAAFDEAQCALMVADPDLCCDEVDDQRQKRWGIDGEVLWVAGDDDVVDELETELGTDVEVAVHERGALTCVVVFDLELVATLYVFTTVLRVQGGAS